jgi:hypothetical protein
MRLHKLKQTIEVAVYLYLLWELLDMITDGKATDFVVARYKEIKLVFDKYNEFERAKNYVLWEAMEVIENASRS